MTVDPASKQRAFDAHRYSVALLTALDQTWDNPEDAFDPTTDPAIALINTASHDDLRRLCYAQACHILHSAALAHENGVGPDRTTYVHWLQQAIEATLEQE